MLADERANVRALADIHTDNQTVADLAEGRTVVFAGTVGKQSTNQQNWLARDKSEEGREAGRVVVYCRRPAGR